MRTPHVYRLAPAAIACAALPLLACRVDQGNLTNVQRADGGANHVGPTDGAAGDVRGVDQQPAADLRLAPPPPADAAAPPRLDAAPPPPADAGPSPPQPPLPPAPPTPMPVPCQVSDWAAWSACSRTCGGGQQSRTRTILVPPANGGSACPVLVEYRDCNTQGCAVDCQVSEWTVWSACSKVCGGGEQSRTRRVSMSAASGGAPCPALAEARPCNTQPANACGGCAALASRPGADCGGCGKVACEGADRTICQDPARTCRALGASCGMPADGCGGQLDCGACADALTACAPSFSCTCGKPTALFSPAGDLQKGKRAASPDGQWFATAEGVFSAAGQLVTALPDVKAFDWHPAQAGRFAVMHHFAPPDALAVITVVQIDGAGRPAPVARATADQWFHAMAWQNGDKLALGGADGGGCTTVTTVQPTP